MVLYICETFHENISSSFQLTEQTPVYDRVAMFNVQRAISPKVEKTVSYGS